MIKNSVLKYISLLSLLLISCGSWAMYREANIAQAALVTDVTVCELKRRANDSIKMVKSVTKSETAKAVTYSAALPDGAMLVASRFPDGEINCILHVWLLCKTDCKCTRHDNGRIPMKSWVFSVLKNVYEKNLESQEKTGSDKQ